jgi:hypothetical protein
MKLRNISKKDFKAIFGQEGYDMVKPYDISVVIVHDETMLTVPGVGAGGGGVMGYDFGDGKGPVMTMFMSPSAIYEGMTELERRSDRAELIVRSYLVHELTHVKQHDEGRLTAIGKQLYWEGEPVNPPSNMREYTMAPWEIEAFAAQRAYATGCSMEQATQEYLMLIEELLEKQAA